jgi:hypothetical protein
MFLTAWEGKLVGWHEGRAVFELLSPLIYETKNGKIHEVPTGFQNDRCSVPRHPAILYGWLGDKLYRQGTLHDFAFRKDAGFTFNEANELLLESCDDHYEGETDEVQIHIMYEAVKLCGMGSYHKYNVMDRLV